MEAHPYSLTSGPSDDFYEVHVRGLGYYTNRLIARAYRKGTTRLWASVEGPYGNMDLAYADNTVLQFVAGGIGNRSAPGAWRAHGPKF